MDEPKRRLVVAAVERFVARLGAGDQVLGHVSHANCVPTIRRLRQNLSRSREALAGELRATFVGPLDDETWERLEEALIYADVGARTTAKVVERLEREAEEGAITGGDDLE